MIDQIRYYLAHDDERIEIARNGNSRAMRDYRIGHRLRQAGEIIERGMTGTPRAAP